MRLFEAMRHAATTRRRRRRDRRPTFDVFEERTLLSDVIPFDPTGGAGANAANVLQVSSFQYFAGNVLAVGGGSLSPASVGKDVTVLYQAIVGAINTTGANSASMGSNNGNIIILPALNNTGSQIVATAEFHETVASFNAATGVVTFTPNFGAAPNFFNLYIQSSANATINDANGGTNQYPGAGGKLIMSGSFVNPNNTFTSSFQNSGAAPVALNQHAGGSGSYPGVNTIVGSGNTGGLVVAVNTALTDTHYFLNPAAIPIITLDLLNVTSATPFTSVDPALKMFNGVAPNIGPLNSGGADFLIQTQATNDFQAVPEPGSISMALVAGALFGARCLWRRRRKVAVV
jgi:hypothetical protein